MGKGSNLGELEELVLLTVGSLHLEAYAVSIMDEIKNQADRSMNVSAIHTVLRRLETKGYLKSEMGGATNERGGRRKRLFVLTALGKKALDESMAYRLSLYNAIPKVSFQFSY